MSSHDRRGSTSATTDMGSNMGSTTQGSSTLYSTDPEVVPSTDPQWLPSPDADGEKFAVAKEVDPTTLPQPASMQVNTDPRSYPQVVGGEYDQDPKSFPQALGFNGMGDTGEDGYKGFAAVSPDGTTTNSPGGAGGADPSAASAASPRRKWYKRKRIVGLIILVALIIIGLVIGLSVALTQGNGGNGDDDSNDNNGNDGGTSQGSPSTGNGSDGVSCTGGLCPPILTTQAHDSRLHIFARTPANEITLLTHDGDSFSREWTSLNDSSVGNIVSQPSSISWDEDGEDTPRLDVFVVSSDSGAVLSRHRIGEDGAWGDWEELGNGAGSAVVACRPRDDRIDLFALDSESWNITHNYWQPNESQEARRKRQSEPDEDEPDEDEPDENEPDEDESPSNPTSANPTPADPSPTNPPGPGGDANSPGSWRFTDNAAWGAISPGMGPAASAPGVCCRDSTVFTDLVWYTRSDGRLMHAQYNRDGSGAWSTPRSVGGNFIGSPVVHATSDDPERFDFFGVQADHELYTFTWRSSRSSADGDYSNLSSLGGSIAGQPSVVSVAEGVYDVVALSTGGTVVHQHYDGSAWRDDWEDLDVKAMSAPQVVEFDDAVWIFSVNADGQLQASSMDGSDARSTWRGQLRTENLGGDIELDFLLAEDP